MAQPNPTTRSLLEITLGFIGAILIVPLVIRVLWGTVKGIFGLGVTRRLISEAVFVGLTTLLTREDVLDKLFGRKGREGDGLLKPPTN